jgi:predicted DNA-binding transcriptional regulator YafY
MPKHQMQKTKLLVLKDYFEKYTDENHGVGMSDIIEYLTGCGIPCERKALYDDIQVLIAYGMDILMQRDGRQTRYYLASRKFEIAELKTLVDIIDASRFITPKKSKTLIEKIGSLCSTYDAVKLSRRLSLTGRVKTANETIYINVDKLHTAFSEECYVGFKYFKYNWKKEKIYRHDGKLYNVIPMALVWNNDNYYLIAYDEELSDIRHYRVDKMDSVIQGQKIPPEKKVFCQNYDTARFSKSVFDMFGGEPVRVELSVSERFIDAMFDRFGTDIVLRKGDNGKYLFTVEVELSPLFYSWISNFEGEVRLVAPDYAVNAHKAHIEKMLETFKGE